MKRMDIEELYEMFPAMKPELLNAELRRLFRLGYIDDPGDRGMLALTPAGSIALDHYLAQVSA